MDPPSASEEAPQAEPAADAARGRPLPAGCAVRLVGLSKDGCRGLNHHVGRVLPDDTGSERLAVALHGVLWSEERGPRDERQPLSVRPSNLRRVRLPEAGALVPAAGCVSGAAVERLLGEAGWGLPDIAVRIVGAHLQVRVVAAEEVSVSGCSSGRGDFPLSAVLGQRTDQWWISAPGSTPQGVGREYLEFSFGDVPRQVGFVGIRIPPMPQGPLSVREFHLLARRRDGDGPAAWEEVSAQGAMRTLDRADMQEFALVPPLQTTGMRLVCTRNAVADEGGGLMTDCIGLFQVRFA